VLHIIDFGDSLLVEEGQTYDGVVGTIHYIPPEIIRRRSAAEMYKGDMWAVGVIAYLLLCGRPPFVGETQQEIKEKITDPNKKKLYYPSRAVLTDSCRDFIESLLCDDPAQRMSSTEALQHEWIAGNTASTRSLANDCLESLRRYQYNNKLQSILVNAILSEMNAEDQRILTKDFTNLNRKRSHMHKDAVVDFLLLYSPVKELDNHEDGWTFQRMASLRGLIEMDSNPDLLDWSAEEGHAICDALAELEDLKELRLKDLDSMSLHSPMSNVQSPSPELQLSMPDDNELQLLNSSSEVFKVSPQQISEKKITTGRFRAIMRQASKSYDVDKVVKELDDGSGFIYLGDIPEFGSPIRTLCDDVISDSENIHLEI